MLSITTNMKTLCAVFFGSVSVAAHGYVQGINVAGTYYDGFDPLSDPYKSDPPTVVGWTASDTNEGFVAPSDYDSGDIICHADAKPARGYATANAGDKVQLYWTDWITSHKGPVVDYLARCADDDCVNVDKDTLEFFKIDGVGLVDDSDLPGTWASDHLIENNSSWVVKIPTTLAPGNYVLRHEIIALHSAKESDGAQNYPQCFNLAVTGTGSLRPAGTPGKALYSRSAAGVLVNIYKSMTGYVVPGPSMIAAGTNMAQSSIRVTASATAVTDVAPTPSKGSSHAKESSSVAEAVGGKVTSARKAPVASDAAAAASAAGSCGKHHRHTRHAHALRV